MIRPFRIEICGGIASGKTTFASLLQDHMHLIFEDFAVTPFWKPFYQTPGLYNFEAEVSFLLHHYHQVKRAKFANSEPMIVCDFSYYLDRAYSAVSLTDAEFEAFEAIHRQVLRDSDSSGLLIHLRCSPETQMQRINARARSVESKITVQFLTSLNQAVDREIGLAGESIPIVSVDSETQDFAHDVKTKDRVRQQILDRTSELQTAMKKELHTI